MKFRRDYFATYQGKEYRVNIKDDGTINLISHDKNDITIGFKHYLEDVYIKPFKKLELDVYYINTLALYKEHIFEAIKEENGQVLISSGDYLVYQKLQLDLVERGVYEKWVNSSEIQKTWEEKTPVEGYVK